MSLSNQITSSLQTFPVAQIAELKRLRLFQGIPKPIVSSLEGKIRMMRVPQGETILELTKSEQIFRYFFFITKGQVKAVGLDEEARIKPLNFLRKGEFFVDKSFSWRSQVATKMVALTEVELLVLPREDLRHVATQFPPLHEKIKQLTEKIDYRNRIYSEDLYARSVLEFLIDNELTQASRVKITQLDKCIECNICYQSCQNRHGFQRLERGYARFGVLDFAKSCITCFYPTCIPACPVDSVIFSLQKGEVEILDSCIGCTACARACQYGAIRMQKVETGDPKFARFVAPGKKIKPKFIADKCNHCDGHEDMVCISNCPTGAIIEVEAADLLENPRIFGTEKGAKKPLPGLMVIPHLDRFLQIFYIYLGIFSVSFLAFEALALSHFPKISFLMALQSGGLIPKDFSLQFQRGSDFCNFLGNIGFTLIFIGMTYPLRKAFPRLFKYLGSRLTWLDLHNFCGMLSLGFITFHTGFTFPMQPSTFGYLALILVVFSGIFGRFLYMMIPRGVAGTELKMKDIEDEDAAVSAKLDALLEGSPKAKEFVNKVVSSLSTQAAENPNFKSMLKAVAQTWLTLIALRIRQPRGVQVNKRQIRVFIGLLHAKIRLRRNQAFLGISSRLFQAWRFFHRPMAYIMVSIAIGHIIYNLLFNPSLQH